jgi:hypothetical protein
LDRHARKNGYEEVGRISATRLTDLLEAFVVDHITQRLKHGDITNIAKGLIYEYWPGFNTATREKIFNDTMADIVVALEGKIKAYLPLYAWNIWLSQRFGFDLLLTIGDDYRIKEWERLTGWVDEESTDEGRMLIAEPRQDKVKEESVFAIPEPDIPDA